MFTIGITAGAKIASFFDLVLAASVTHSSNRRRYWNHRPEFCVIKIGCELSIHTDPLKSICFAPILGFKRAAILPPRLTPTGRKLNQDGLSIERRRAWQNNVSFRVYVVGDWLNGCGMVVGHESTRSLMAPIRPLACA